MITSRVEAVRRQLGVMLESLENGTERAVRRAWGRAQTELLSLVQLGEFQAMQSITDDIQPLEERVASPGLREPFQRILSDAVSVLQFLNLWSDRVQEDEALYYVAADQGRALRILHTIRASAPITHGALADRVGVRSNHLSNLMKRLLEYGLVSRNRQARYSFYDLTSTGLRTLERLPRLSGESELDPVSAAYLLTLADFDLSVSALAPWCDRAEELTVQRKETLERNARLLVSCLRPEADGTRYESGVARKFRLEAVQICAQNDAMIGTQDLRVLEALC